MFSVGCKRVKRFERAFVRASQMDGVERTNNNDILCTEGARVPRPRFKYTIPLCRVAVYSAH